MTARRIIHVDMDAFYAAVEQLDHPELRGRPVIVGASPNARGVVSAASYEARAFGVRSAMPSAQAARLCPHAVFLPVRMGRYIEVSRQVMAILGTYTPQVEQVSVDEAFLDVTGSRRLFGDAPTIGREIKRRIREELGLTASVGIAPNKFLAKIASDLGKPDGFVVVEEGKEREFLHPLSISRLWGVGQATEQRLRRLGIETIGQLAAYPADALQRQFGEVGRHLCALAHGHDDRPVASEHEAKSVSSETTFMEDTTDLETWEQTLLWLSEQVGARVRAAGLRGQTVHLKVRFGDFTTITRRQTLAQPTDATETIYRTARRLLHRAVPLARRLRLLGVGLSGFKRGEQKTLFGDSEEVHSALDEALDCIRERFGTEKVQRGRLLREE